VGYPSDEDFLEARRQGWPPGTLMGPPLKKKRRARHRRKVGTKAKLHRYIRLVGNRMMHSPNIDGSYKPVPKRFQQETAIMFWRQAGAPEHILDMTAPSGVWIEQDGTISIPRAVEPKQIGANEGTP
jgi:hypothetical protein